MTRLRLQSYSYYSDGNVGGMVMSGVASTMAVAVSDIVNKL